MYYQRNRLKAQFKNTDPTLADQAGARDTDINVIVKRFTQTGMVPGSQQTPMSGDFTNLPRDLRGYIETSKQLHALRHRLPKELQDMDFAELLALRPDELTAILTPKPADPPAKTEEKPE